MMPTEEFCCDDYCNLRSNASLFITISLSRDRNIWRIGFEKGPARAKSVHEDETYFLNVDLDVFGRSSLEPLASAFGSKVSQLYVGPHWNHYRAHFELRASLARLRMH
jgi:hypothetical protein